MRPSFASKLSGVTLVGFHSDAERASGAKAGIFKSNAAKLGIFKSNAAKLGIAKTTTAKIGVIKD